MPLVSIPNISGVIFNFVASVGTATPATCGVGIPIAAKVIGIFFKKPTNLEAKLIDGVATFSTFTLVSIGLPTLGKTVKSISGAVNIGETGLGEAADSPTEATGAAVSKILKLGLAGNAVAKPKVCGILTSMGAPAD